VFRPGIPPRSGMSTRFRVLSVMIVFGCSFLAWTGQASADYTWTGDFYCGGQYGCSYATGWHEGNWTTGPPEASAPNLGTLSFPALPNCGQGTCYGSLDDLNFAMSATAIDIDDAVGYQVQSDDGDGPAPAIGLGSGGITATPAAASNAPVGGVWWGQPLDLTTAQSWSLSGDGTWQDTPFAIDGPITAGGASPAADALTIKLASTQYLTFLDGLEVGAVTVSGANSSDSGETAAQNGTLYANDINGDDGAPVTIDNVVYAIEPNEDDLPHTQTVGPLTTNGAFLQIGDGNTPHDAILDVNGAVNLGAGTVTGTEIDQSGATPGSDFAQLSASGNITLGGDLIADGGVCSVGVGDVATPITTTGTLSGTFSNVPDGAMTPLQPCFASNLGATGVQIGYTNHSMTETVVPGSSTATLLTANPLSPTANQSVTLTANVTAATFLYYGPAGAVEFFDGTTPIPGCTAQPLTASDANAGSATCTTSFASPDMADVTAAFTPTGSTITGSTSGAPGAGAGSSGGGSTTGGGGGSATGGGGSTGSGGDATSVEGGASGPSSGGSSPATSSALKSAIAKIGNTKVARTGVGVPLSCSGGLSCTLSLTLSITEHLKNGQVTAITARAPKTKVMALGHVTVTIASNGTRTVSLSLNATGKRLLHQHHKLAVRLTISSMGRTLGSKVLTFKLSVKRQ
jgi:hypothetical protein